MGTYDESILTETKKVLGIADNVTAFDTDVRMHINSAFGTLNQLGIGPEGGFEVINADQTWADILVSDLKLNPVKSYVYLRVRMLFDPPSNSWLTVAMKEQIEQLEWRLNSVREDAIPVPSPPPEDEEVQYWLDGGVV
jgi:hypothetical protein